MELCWDHRLGLRGTQKVSGVPLGCLQLMAMLERVLLGIGGIIDILYPNWSISIFNASLNYAFAAAQSIRGTTHDSPF